MLTLLTYTLTTALLIFVLLPSITTRLLKYFLALDILTLKMYSLLHYKSFFLKLSVNNRVWGIDHFILSIPDITVNFNFKLFRVVISMNSLEAFFVHNDFHLNRVNVIQGLMEPNLVANLLHFVLKGTKFEDQDSQKLMKLYGGLVKKSLQESKVRLQRQESAKETVKKSKTATILQGSFHFLIMMVFQFLEIRLNDNTVSFVSSIPKPPRNENPGPRQNSAPHSHNQLSFKTPHQRKSSLLLLRNLSEQTLKIENLTTKVAVINHFQQQVQVLCPRFSIINWSHPHEHMLMGRDFFLGIKVPLTLQISESLKSLQYGIKVDSLQFNTVPKDYELVMLIIKSFNFSFEKLEKLFVHQFIDDNAIELAPEIKSDQILRQQTTVSVQISKVSLVIESLYEINIDQKDAHEYLSNISEARFSLTGICFKSKEFKIEESILKINKFGDLPLIKNTKKYNGSKSSRVSDIAMIMIPKIVFTFYDKQTRVFHNPTELYCGREELALLGKLFRLINERMRFDELGAQFYLKLFTKFVEFQLHGLEPAGHRATNFKVLSSLEQGAMKRNSLKDVNLVELFSYVCFIDKAESGQKPLLQAPEHKQSQSSDLPASQSKSQQQYHSTGHAFTNQFIYEPSSLTFRLLIQNLEHTLYLPNCSYKQVIKQQEFQHILSIPSLELVYHQAKEFGVKDLKMIFRQIPTLNQFALFVDAISMTQNQQTLVQYLAGWIVIKKLLQITARDTLEGADQKDETAVTVNKKLAKKTIVIRKLELDYEKEKISIKKIQLEKTTLPNDKTIKMYLSLDKCEFSTKLNKNIGYGLKKTPPKPQKSHTNLHTKQQKPIDSSKRLSKTTKLQEKPRQIPDNNQDKNAIEVVHNLFSFESLTVNVKLQNFPKTINNRKSFSIQKQKSLIHLKNPQINLPYFDISKKMSTVLQSYVNLKPHISAYIKDKTQNQFTKIQRNIKDFLIEPDCLHLKVTNFVVVLEQQPLNKHLENYHRFIREFMAKADHKSPQKISEIEVISFLKKNKRQSKLCKLSVKEIECEIQPLKYLSNDTKDSVDEWIKTFKKSMEFHPKEPKSSKTLENRQIRLRKVEGAEYRFGIKNVQFSIRDYPDSILSLNHVSFKIGCIKTSNIFNLKNYFFTGQLKFGKMTINAGLNMLSGFLQIRKKIISYMEVFQKFQKTTEFTSNIKQAQLKRKHSMLQEKRLQLSYQPWWFILFNSSHWQFHFIKEPTKLYLYTGTTPYQKQCFQIVLGNVQCRSERQNTILSLSDLQISLTQSKILYLQSIKSSLMIVDDQQRNFNIIIDVFASNAGKIVLSKATVQYLSTLKQLRNDWLIIYGLYTQNAYDDDEMLHKKQKMNYIEIINFTANKMIDQDDKNITFLSAVRQIHFKVHIQEFTLVLTNWKQGIELGMQEFSVDHEIRAVKHIKNKWQTIKSILQVNRIWGSLQTDPASNDTKNQRLTEHLKSNEENVFLAARKLRLNFNKFKLLRESAKSQVQSKPKDTTAQKQASEIIFIRKFMQLQSIKFAMSLKIKKSIQKLILSYSPQKLKQQFEQKSKKIILQSNLTPVQKFKSAVWKVIRINKLRRRKTFGIKHFMFFAKITKIEAVLMSGKHSVMIDSQEPVRFDMGKIYKEDDKNFVSPVTRIMLKLFNVEINLAESSQSNIVNLLNKSLYVKEKSEHKKLSLSHCETIELLMHLKSEDLAPGEQSHLTGKLTLSNGNIELTQKTKSILIELIDFLVQFTSDKEKQRLDFRRVHQKFNELQNNGRTILKQSIQSAYKNAIGQKQKLAFKWIFELKNTSIQLIIPVDEKVKFSVDSVSFFKISKPFVKIDSKLICCELNFFNNDKIQKTFQLNDLTVENLLQKESSVFRKIVSMNHNDNLALYMTIESYELMPLSSIVWEYFDSIKIHINPINFKVTEKLYQKFYQFLFPDQPLTKTQQKPQKLLTTTTQTPQNYQQRFIPDYIQNMQMDDIKVQVWFETESLLKRMEGISVGLNPYKVQNTFSTKKELFDEWIKFVLKQMAGQIFNVLGQKIFGSSQKGI